MLLCVISYMDIYIFMLGMEVVIVLDLELVMRLFSNVFVVYYEFVLEQVFVWIGFGFLFGFVIVILIYLKLLGGVVWCCQGM